MAGLLCSLRHSQQSLHSPPRESVSDSEAGWRWQEPGDDLSTAWGFVKLGSKGCLCLWWSIYNGQKVYLISVSLPIFLIPFLKENWRSNYEQQNSYSGVRLEAE